MASKSTSATPSIYVKEHLPKKNSIPPLKLFDPPTLPKKQNFLLPALPFDLAKDSNEKRILVIVASGNDSKSNLIAAHLHRNRPPNATLLEVFSFPQASSGVGEQPYSEAGIDGAYNRIDHVLALTPQITGAQLAVSGKRITTIIYAAIESFIARPGYPPLAPGEEPSTEPVDYAYIVLYNAVTRVVKTGVSKGVSVPEAYYKEAQKYGFSDPVGQALISQFGKGKTLPKEAQKNHGKLTVGEIMAANIEGLDKGNWHKFLTDGEVCRYKLIQGALDKMEIPW